MVTDAALETLEVLLERMPDDVVASFTPDQKAALWAALNPGSWHRHPVNLRLTLPYGKERFFLTIIGGPEKRTSDRRRRERRLYPWSTLGNVLFLLGVGAAFYICAIIGFLVFSRLIHF